MIPNLNLIRNAQLMRQERLLRQFPRQILWKWTAIEDLPFAVAQGGKDVDAQDQRAMSLRASH